MCAQFIIKAQAKVLRLKYGIEIPEDFEISQRVLPHQDTVVITENSEHKPVLRSMRFSLLPSWSKEPRVKFATHNARMETLIEKPTWKRPFLNHRCLVPISEFIEPIYENELAGNMVRFSRSDDSLLTAAGIYDSWVNPTTGEIIDSFSIVTTAPPVFIEETGHDRCPVFLKEKSFHDWLNPDEKNPERLLSLLKEQQDSIDFKVEKDRPLKAGWEKRR